MNCLGPRCWKSLFRRKPRRSRLLSVAMLLALNAQPATALAQVFYTNDFNVGAGSEWSNQTTAISNGERFLGESANGFGNGIVFLTLGNLPTHAGVTIQFDLYAIQSLDGNGPQGGGPDHWQLTADGANVLFSNFANYGGANTQAYPNQLPPFGPGGSFPPRTGSFETNHLGFGTGDFGDTTYRFSLSFPHSSTSIVFGFHSMQNQGTFDEGWGLDNVTVSVTPIPEPTSFVLCGFAMGMLGLRLKRRVPIDQPAGPSDK